MIEQSNIECIYTTAAILAPSLGPCGMDKLLVDEKGDILVTNDGATILSYLPIIHPANKLLLNLAQTQERDVGDGTTTTVLLASSLLQQSLTLFRSGVHPTVIIQEYKKALSSAKQILKSISVSISSAGSNNENLLRHIAKTAISSKVLGRYHSFFSDLAVSAVRCLNEPSFNKVKIITRTGDTMTNSKLIPSGIQLKAWNHPSLLFGALKQPRDGTILVTNANLNTGRGTGQQQVTGTSVAAVDGHEYQAWADANVELERKSMLDVCKSIVSLGVRVVAALSPFSPVAERFLVEHGVLPIAVSSIDELEQVALCTSCTVATFLSSPNIKVGEFKAVDIVASRDVYSNVDSIYIEGTGREMCSVELVAPTDGLVAECERSFVDMLRAVLTALAEPQVVGGGGCVPIELSVRLREQRDTTSPYSSVCKNAFCDGLLVIPQTLAINAGYDAVKLIQACCDLHQVGHTWHAVDLECGQLADMLELGIVEPVAVFREGLAHAVAMVELVLKTDKNIIANKRQELF